MMMPGNLFRLQLMETFGNVRHTAMRIGVSLLLAMPFIFVGMPANVKSAGIVMVILFTAFFGSAIAHARLREDLRFSRLMLLPISRGLIWLDLILSSALSRIVPTLVVLIAFTVFNSSNLSYVFLISLAATLCMVMLLLVLFGMLIGQFARNNAEVHLFSALMCAMVAFFSGVTPSVEKLTWLTNAMAWNPIHRLLSALIAQINGTTTVSIPQIVLSSVILTLFCLTATFRWTAGKICLVK